MPRMAVTVPWPPIRVLRFVDVVAATGIAFAVLLMLTGCGRGGDANLWSTEFEPRERTTLAAADITGYWEGDVAMGGIRIKVEPAALTLALKCDAAGRKLAQAKARIGFERGRPARMILDEELAGGDEDCGFRFDKGAAFAYALDDRGLLDIAFAGTSVSRVAKRAELAR